MKSELDLRTMEIVAAVIEDGSMSTVGATLGLTQSAISQAVRRAERHIGAALLHRDCRPMVPTNAGRVLAKQARDIARRMEQALGEIRAATARPEELDLRLGMVDTFASTIGPHLIRELMDGAMALRLTALSGLAPAQMEGMLRHRIDVAVTADSMDELDELARYPLYREPFVLVYPQEWTERLAGLGLSEILDRQRLIRYSAHSHTGIQIERHLRRLGLEPPHMLSFDTSDSLLAMVSSGVGVAITTPLCILQGSIHSSALCIRPLPRPGFSRTITLVTRRNESTMLGPRIAEMARLLIRRHTVPQLVELIPWLAESAAQMVLSSDPNVAFA